ncbi:MAG: aminotransferase class V-fold PLP-dependent enzyme, partial [Campylobacter sp.]|nr:aminotransferase class V-fold PLP-dependent enzyme [Campylobacter sp.]
SPYEHHSNEIPLRYCLCEVVRVPLNSQGLIDFDFLANLLKANKGREIIASFSVASNLTGIISDYKKLYLMIKSHGGTLILDGSAFVPHDDIDFGFCDGAVFSPHKLLGGVGSSGILVVKNSLFKTELPTFGGGGTLAYADDKSVRFHIDNEMLEEAGTPGLTQLLRGYLAYKFRCDFVIENIKSHENELSEYFLSEISKIDEIEIYGNLQTPRVPIFAINLKGLDPFIFAEILSKKYLIQVRAGCACAAPYGRDLLNMPNDINLTLKPAFLRISLNFSHNKDDIDYLLTAIKNIVKNKDKIRKVGGEYKC